MRAIHRHIQKYSSFSSASTFQNISSFKYIVLILFTYLSLPLTDDNDFQYPVLIPLHSAAHGGDDVAVFADGPWAHLFTGMYEQSVIPHFMAFASCIGDELTACND